MTDSSYSNLGLACYPVQKKVHLFWTLGQNVTGVPWDVLQNAKTKKGEIVGKGSNAGTVVENWTDKKNVRFIAMRYSLMMADTEKKNRKTIPNIILQPPQTRYRYICPSWKLLYGAEENSNTAPQSSF